LPSRTAHHLLARSVLSVCGLGLLLSLMCSGGCYQRVVAAKGLGADNYTVSEPYQESGQLDEWIFGSPGPTGKPTNHTKLPQ
jgi:hypothetical protein